MGEYKPVPVHAAAQIADLFEKDVVVIFAIDAANCRAHYTTFGRLPGDKLLAAEYGALFARAVHTRDELDQQICFEDFRLEAAKLKAQRDQLLKACKLWDEGFEDGEQFTPDQLLKWLNDNRRAIRAAVAAVEGNT